MNDTINLDGLRIASPCNARWEDMSGDDRARFCGSCRKHVYNLSTMTRAEIHTLIREKEGKFCGRLYRRADGRLLTTDCPARGRRQRRHFVGWAGTALSSVLLFFGVRISLRAAETNQTRVLMGEMPALTGDVAMPPQVQGRIIAPPELRPICTNPPVMGIIAPGPKTNSPASK